MEKPLHHFRSAIGLLKSFFAKEFLLLQTQLKFQPDYCIRYNANIKINNAFMPHEKQFGLPIRYSTAFVGNIEPTSRNLWVHELPERLPYLGFIPM